MALICTSKPTNSPVGLAEVKEHLRIDSDYEDAQILSYIDAAVQRLDGRDGWLGRCLITQTWTLTLDRFPEEIALPLPPCQSVGSITYVDPTGDTITLAASEYQPFGLGDVRAARIQPSFGKSWPSTRGIPEAVSIAFIAGYGDISSSVPAPIRAAIAMHVGHLFEFREGAADGDADLISDQKIWTF